jgi:magnesium-transporting ATPase (P-type)
MIDIDQLAKQLETTIKKHESDKSYFGLTDTSAQEKLRINGPNALTEKGGIPWIFRYLLLMTGLFNYMLWIGSILCFIAYGLQVDKTDKSNLYLAIVLIFVILITATMSYI